MSKTVVPMFFSRRGNKTKNKQIVNSSVTKEARIYNGEQTVSSITSAGKTRQLLAKE